jgi:hypothetical protein
MLNVPYMDQISRKMMLNLWNITDEKRMEQPDDQHSLNDKPKSAAGKIYFFIAVLYLLFGVLYLINRS